MRPLWREFRLGTMISKKNIYIISKMTLYEALRGKIIRILAVISLLLLTVNFTITQIYSWSLGKVAIELGLSTSAVTGLLIIFFLSLKILYNDLERHSIYFLLSRPVSIIDYLFGKFFGLASILCLSMIILGVGTAISIQNVIWNYTAYMAPHFSWLTFAVALLFQTLSLLVVLAIAIFWFSFITEAFVALILSLCSYQLCQSMELIRQLFVDSYKGDKLDQVSYFIALGLTYIFPNLSFFDLKTQAAYGLPLSYQNLLVNFFYGCSYIFILLFLSVFFFSKRKTL